MQIGLMTQVRLLEEAVSLALGQQDPSFSIHRLVSFDALRAALTGGTALALVIVDVTQRIDLDEVRRFHAERPDLPLMALGLREQVADVIAHGSAGFTSYLRREEGLDALCAAVIDAIAGRLTCSPEITAAIMRALFSTDPVVAAPPGSPLTPRETEIATMLRQGFSNKEIARAFDLSESTVKHHVHQVLAKHGMNSRIQLLRLARQGLAA